jgi:hypothetical protein
MAERILEWTAQAGFEEIRIRRLPLEPVPVVCVLGNTSPISIHADPTC